MNPNSPRSRPGRDAAPPGECSEHDRIFLAIENLKAWCLEVGQLGRPRINELGTKLSEIGSLLEKHFEAEEAGGYLVDVVARLPAAQHEVDRLRGEHAELRDRFSRLVASLCCVEPEINRWAVAVDQANKLLTDVEGHERREVNLMQSAAALTARPPL